MPYSKAEFDLDKQAKFKSAVASAAGTTSDNVDILSITEQRRRAGGIIVETKIRASDETKLEQISESLGSGDVGTKINSELKKQGLSESTGVTQVTSGGSQEKSGGGGGATIIVVVVVVVVLVFAAGGFYMFQRSKSQQDPAAPTLGLKWTQTGAAKPTQGRELANPELATALASKITFTQREWEGFRIHDLRHDDFIKSGGFYFKPAATASKPSAPPAKPVVVGSLQAAGKSVEVSTRPNMQARPANLGYGSGFPGRL